MHLCVNKLMLSLFSFLDQPLPSIFKNNTVLCLFNIFGLFANRSYLRIMSTLWIGGTSNQTLKKSLIFFLVAQGALEVEHGTRNCIIEHAMKMITNLKERYKINKLASSVDEIVISKI